MGLRPSHGTWHWIEDPVHPPAFTPAEAAQRLPRRAWQRTVRADSHGKELVRHVAELELGTAYGPTQPVRLVVATLDPGKRKPASTWYLVTSLPLGEASAEQVYELYRLRDWIEHFDKPAKHELGWADYQMRPERAMVRHWQLVMLAFTFSLLVGALPAPTSQPPITTDGSAAGGKIGAHPRVRSAGRLARHAASGAGVAVPVGTPAGLLAALVEQRPSARAGRAARPRRPRSSA
jgi:hypothetical protein